MHAFANGGLMAHRARAGPGRRFDYQAVEPEEISFMAGELLIQFEDEDEQGWCTGRNLNGDTGLYPASYVAAES